MAGSHRRPARHPQLSGTHRGSRGSRHRGIALVLVLWTLTLLTVMAVGMTATQRTETALTENVIAEARFRAQSDAAIAYAAFTFLNPPPEPAGVLSRGGSGADTGDEAAEWLPNGVPRPWTFDGTPINIAVFNEQSRINLNRATVQVLTALLEALGAEEETAAGIADAIADWRDEDDLKLLNGAEDPDYEHAGRPFGAKDAPFVAVEELQQVMGVSPEVYARMAPELTVDTDNDQVDTTFASAAVIAGVQGIDLAAAQLLIEQRDQPAVPGGQPPRAVARGGPLYRVQVREQGNGAVRGMEALITLEPGQPQPYRVLWKRFGLLAAPRAAPGADGG